MQHDAEPAPPGTLSRRSALVGALQISVAVASLAPAATRAAPPAPASPPTPPPAPAPAPEFVPENDYPLFGGTLPEGY